LVITQELLISLPAAEIVNITPTGNASYGSTSLTLKRHGSSLVLAPKAMDFAESMTEPPPTANTNSICSCLQISTPFRTREIFGFGSTHPNSIQLIPALVNESLKIS